MLIEPELTKLSHLVSVNITKINNIKVSSKTGGQVRRWKLKK